MKTFLTVIEVIAALGVIISILLHSPKGEGMGSIGGTARIFVGQKGLEAGLDRITYVCAAVFIIAAIIIVAI